MSRWQYFNPHPSGKRIGDCSIRALCKALDLDWKTLHLTLSVHSYALEDMQLSNRAIHSILKQHGFHRRLLDDFPEDYTVADFCKDHPTGTYVLATDGHVVCVKDGEYFDTWDSGDEIPIYYWTKGG